MEETNDDATLVTAALGGDYAAWNELMRLLTPTINKAIGTIGLADDREDYRQLCLLHLFRKLHLFRGESALTTWVFQVSRNVALTELRKRKRIEKYEVLSVDDTYGEDGGMRFDPGYTPKEFGFAGDRIELRKVIAGLPPGYRANLELRLQGYEFKEIATRLGKTVVTAKSQVRKAIKIVTSRMLEGEMAECSPCREEGKGGIVAHYEADVRRKRPAMCFTHYWAEKKTPPQEPGAAVGVWQELVEPKRASSDQPVAEETSRLQRWHDAEMCGLPTDDGSKLEPYCNRPLKLAHRLHTFNRGTTMPEWYEYQVIVTGKERPEIRQDRPCPNCIQGNCEQCVTLEREQTLRGGTAYFLLHFCNCFNCKQGRRDISELSDGSKRTGAGRRTGEFYKTKQRAEASELLVQGKSVRAVSQITGLSPATVLAVRKEVAAQLPQQCECGRPNGHRGWCTQRVAASPARQETVKMLHQRQAVEETTDAGVEVPTVAELPPRVEPTPSTSLRNNSSGNKPTIFVHLRSGGCIQLFMDLDLFSISKEDREFVFGIIDSAREYSAKRLTGQAKA